MRELGVAVVLEGGCHLTGIREGEAQGNKQEREQARGPAVFNQGFIRRLSYPRLCAIYYLGSELLFVSMQAFTRA